tara:strand:- start:192 stop:3518 length:3327 start_codon:yes stop_codon:yes gene_type:complete
MAIEWHAQLQPINGGADYWSLIRGKDIDITEGASALTGLADADIFLVDDAAAGVQSSTKYITAAHIGTYMSTNLDGLTIGVDDTGHDVKFFGASAGAYMEWDESADQLRIMGASADATTSTGKLLLATSLTDINANDVLGKIEFQAPHEAGATDAILVSAAIEAVAQGTFAADLNATDLIFKLGHSEVAAEKFRMTSQGEIGIAGTNYGTDGQVLTSGGAGAACAWEDAAGAVTVADSTADTYFPVVLHDESNNLLDDTGAFTYNPSAAIAKISNLYINVDANANDNTADSTTGMLSIGAGADLNLYHGGSDSWIIEKTGSLVISTTAAGESLELTKDDLLNHSRNATIGTKITTTRTGDVIDDASAISVYGLQNIVSGRSAGAITGIITGVTRSGATATYTTSTDPHGLDAGDVIVISGTTNFNTSHLATQVVQSAATTTTFTMTLSAETAGNESGLTAPYTSISANDWNNYGIWNLLVGDTVAQNTETVNNYGMFTFMQGGNINYGQYIQMDTSGATESIGVYIDNINGGVDYKSVSSANATDYFTMSTTTNGATTIATVDASDEEADLTFNIDGFIDMNSAVGENITLDSGGAINIEPYAGSAILLDGTISVDAGVVTGATSITSTAFVGALTGNASGTAATVTGAAQTNITSLGTLTGLGMVSTATTANALDIQATALTTGSALVINVDDSLTSASTKTLLYIDYDKSGVTASAQVNQTVGLDVNMADAATNDASGAVSMLGARINIDSANAQGAIYQTGLSIYVGIDGVGDASLTSGIQTRVMDGGTDIKMMSSADLGDYCSISTTTHGATTIATVDDDDAEAAHLTFDIQGDTIFKGDIADGTSTEVARIDSSASSLFIASDKKIEFGDAANFIYGNALDSFMEVNRDFELEVGRGIDIKATAALNLESGDNIVIDAVDTLTIDTDGTFIMMKDGTEYSVANSAYAGMILGYRMIGEDAAPANSGNLGTSFAVISDDATVRFKAPPSGVVEVTVQVYITTSSNAEVIEFALSTTDTTSYTSLGVQYEQKVYQGDRSEDGVIQHSWVVTGLTAGDIYNYWLAAEATTGSTRLSWGGDSTSEYPDFIMKVIALPAATADYAVYG